MLTVSASNIYPDVVITMLWVL